MAPINSSACLRNEGRSVNMAPINPSTCPPSFSICPLQAGIPCKRTVTGKCCCLLYCLAFGNGFYFSHSKHYPLNPTQEPSTYSLFSFQASDSPELLIRRSTMVRHRMRSRKGGDRGGSTRSQVAHNEALPPPPISPPPSQASSLPPSLPNRHYPHSAFHSNHFRFQSNLNRPLITANITIILFGEEDQHRAPVLISAEQPQNIRRMEVCFGSE